jgi:hypothetical protein
MFSLSLVIAETVGTAVSGLRRVHGGDNPVGVVAQRRPLRMAQNDERDFPRRKILLILNILVGGNEKLEACRLSRVEQFAVTGT